jgi:hypothetical protein
MSDAENIKIKMNHWEARFIFVLQIITNIVVMLNLLISIIGDSFDQVQENFMATDYQEKCGLILEVEELINLFSSS